MPAWPRIVAPGRRARVPAQRRAPIWARPSTPRCSTAWSPTSAPAASARRCCGPHGDDPFGSALPLRFLGSVHRIVLEGRAPALAAHYPSAGGTPGPSLAAPSSPPWPSCDRRSRPASTTACRPTRSAGRRCWSAATPRWPGAAGLPLRVLEIGASAGLNLRWDRFWYDTGASTLGDPDQPRALRRRAGTDDRAGARPDVPVERGRAGGLRPQPARRHHRRGPPHARSYLWPDQVERRARLDAAIAVAARVPATVERADVADWVEARLAEPAPGVATVVVHSIVWQYLSHGRAGPHARPRRAAGRRAGDADAPLAWLRMEPAGPVGRAAADVVAGRRGGGAGHRRLPRPPGLVGRHGLQSASPPSRATGCGSGAPGHGLRGGGAPARLPPPVPARATR